MTISKNKVRANLVIERDIKKQLEDIAVRESRSFNSLIIKIVKDFLELEGKK